MAYTSADEAEAALGADCVRIREKRGRWDVVLQMPALKDWDYYLAQANNPATKAHADISVIRSMLVFPTREAFDELRKRMPTIAQAISSNETYIDFLGLRTVEQEK
jgi:hypothetical protein